MQTQYWAFRPKRGWVAVESRGASPECPQCQGVTYRVRRRLVDRLISLLVSVRRFQCQAYACRWEGNLLAQSRHAPGESAGGGAQPARRI